MLCLPCNLAGSVVLNGILVELVLIDDGAMLSIEALQRRLRFLQLRTPVAVGHVADLGYLRIRKLFQEGIPVLQELRRRQYGVRSVRELNTI